MSGGGPSGPDLDGALTLFQRNNLATLHPARGNGPTSRTPESRRWWRRVLDLGRRHAIAMLFTEADVELYFGDDAPPSPLHDKLLPYRWPDHVPADLQSGLGSMAELDKPIFALMDLGSGRFVRDAFAELGEGGTRGEVEAVALWLAADHIRRKHESSPRDPIVRRVRKGWAK